MRKSPMPTLQKFVAHFHEAGLEMASIRTALDIQWKRIAQMQAELDEAACGDRPTPMVFSLESARIARSRTPPTWRRTDGITGPGRKSV
jgi:hypothetical protein